MSVLVAVIQERAGVRPRERAFVVLARILAAMSDEQQQADALDALKSAIAEASDALLEILGKERDARAADVPMPVAGGLQLAYALGRLSDEQRRALHVGATLSDADRKLLVALLERLEK
jgi:hypothetical protein